jgi:hypothetical protein
MHVTIYTAVTGFEILAPEWDKLLERSVSAPFFMRLAYQRIWWKHLGPGELRLIASARTRRATGGVGPAV